MPIPQAVNGEPMKRRGFTLVELLVVIAIAAIILAITLTIAHGVMKMVRSLGG
jgi:prepilin-type N-terminal cleavage/methylation domain-containing protein